MLPVTDPSPLLQTAVYMAAMLAGYAMLTSPREWSRAWQTVRTVLRRERL